MPIDLYHMISSAPCLAVRLVADALGVDLNLKLLDLTKAEHLKPEFLKINPQHCIPTLNDDGFILWESRAICTYLIEKYGKDDSLYPKDPKQRAVVNQRLYFDLGSFSQSYAQYVYSQILGGEPADPAKLEKCHEAAAFLNQFLEGKDYVAGDHLTVADISLLTSAACYSVIDHDFDIGKYKNIVRWMKKVSAEIPKYNEVVEEGMKVYKLWVHSLLKK